MQRNQGLDGLSKSIFNFLPSAKLSANGGSNKADSLTKIASAFLTPNDPRPFSVASADYLAQTEKDDLFRYQSKGSEATTYSDVHLVENKAFQSMGRERVMET